MGHERQVTFALHRLTNRIRRLTDGGVPAGERVTQSQGRVIGLIKRSGAADVYQRDVEREFMIRRSTASAIVQGMERAGLLRREPVASDARLKRLVLTPRAEMVSDRFVSEMERVEAVITRGVDPAAMDMFFRTIAQFEGNLMEYTAAIEGKPCGARDEEGKE